MPIYRPGKRSRGRFSSPSKRNVVAVLSLTAMVDMFTVLAVFLLQNYATTGQIIHLPKEITLPNAARVKELKPSNVVTITANTISFNTQNVASISDVRQSKDWMIDSLREQVENFINRKELDKKSFINKTRQAVNTKINQKPLAEKVDDFRKITIQADKSIDFLSVKKVMFTVTEAGIYQINFAVIKKEIDSVAALQ